MKTLTYPFTEEAVRALRAGDAVSISGLVHTGRDKFHKFFADGGKIPVDFRDGALYHCGPVVVPVDAKSVRVDSVDAKSVRVDSVDAKSVRVDSVDAKSVRVDSVDAKSVRVDSVDAKSVRVGRGKDSASTWRVVAAGPTTSVRENPYEPDFIAKSGVRLIIGKGGMDAATLAAMKRHGCVYIQAVGGAAALAAASVKRVAGVDLLDEFGAAEACWHFEMENFRGVVAMDAHGNSLFADVASSSAARLRRLMRCA